MKSEVTATESVHPTSMLSPRVELSPRAGTCPGADEDESAAKYLFKLSRDVILSLDRVGKHPLHQSARRPTERLFRNGIARSKYLRTPALSGGSHGA